MAHCSTSHNNKAVGQSVERKDGSDKASGKAKYVDDLDIPGLWYGVTIRSEVARGRIRGIEFKPGVPWSEIVVVSSKDIPGDNCVAHILKDQPCLVAHEIKHFAEPILLLAYHDKEVLELARRLVRIDVDEQPAIFSIEQSLRKDQVICGKDNIFKSYLIEKGSVDSVWGRPDIIIVDGEYSTAAQEHCYIEPNGMIANIDDDGAVTVCGSMQCPFYVHHALTTLLALPAEKVRVIQAETGGGFGGKEDFPSMLACHAALLALKSKKSVKMIYDRAEDMAATTKRHPSRTKHRTAVDKDGHLLAMDIEFVLDGGAYATLSAVVLSRGSIHAAGPYKCPNVRIKSKAVATNHPPFGAFRGFGVPQSIFALERHMDKIAKRLNLTPDELRRRNFIKQGECTATGQVIRDNVSLSVLLDAAIKASAYYEKRKTFSAQNQIKPGVRQKAVKKGIGIAAFMHGGGFTGAGEKNLASIASVEATKEGRIRILASSTEIGQGARTVFTQIVADALGIGVDLVDVATPDTATVPNSGPTVASRTTMVVGKLIEGAASQLREILFKGGYLTEPYSQNDFTSACRAYVGKTGPLKASTQYQQPEFINWDDANHRGDAYGTFAWAVYIAEVSVDPISFETTVDNVTAVQEVGKVVNPVLAAGQIEGGVVQGVGYSLYENVIWKNGRMANNRLTDYIIPTSVDTPNVNVIFFEDPYPHGPQGAKGIGELPMDGVAPAILNAVEFATGAEVDSIPMTPEVLMEAMR